MSLVILKIKTPTAIIWHKFGEFISLMVSWQALLKVSNSNYYLKDAFREYITFKKRLEKFNNGTYSNYFTKINVFIYYVCLYLFGVL